MKYDIKRILRDLPRIRLPFPKLERPRLEPEFIPVERDKGPFKRK